jgi:hypothetical protein
MVVALFMLLCVGSGAANVESSVHTADRLGIAVPPQYSVRAHRWNLLGVQGKSVEIGASFIYCAMFREAPKVVSVSQRRKPGRVVLTMFVRLPPSPKHCFTAIPLHIFHWVKVGPGVNRLALYDGRTSPPARRRRTGVSP